MNQTVSGAKARDRETRVNRKLISLVVPVFNEEDNVKPLYAALSKVIEGLSDRYEWEFIFTDNHSEDATFVNLKELAARDHRIRVFRFSRNFGFQRSIMTGYGKARGDAAIQIDCDLQDPPELIIDFIRHWEQGYRVVYGIRRNRQESFWLHSIRRIFYRVLNFLSEDDLPLDAGDFRLVDRCILDEIRCSNDLQPYLRGMIASMGFRQIGIPYDRSKRHKGKTSFAFGDLVKLAMDGIASHSILPLRLASYVGIGISILAAIGSAAIFAAKIFLPDSDWPAGFASLAVLMLATLAVNSIFLGVIGEYVGRIFRQVKGRSITIVEQSINADELRRSDN